MKTQTEKEKCFFLTGSLITKLRPYAESMDLSKAFNTINYDLMIVKLKAHGFPTHAMNYMKSYSKISKKRSTLTHIMAIPLVSFYTPRRHQKTFGFLMSSGGIERNQ